LTGSELKMWLERAESDNLDLNAMSGLVKVPAEEGSEEPYVWGAEASE
jgi:hypothetical protein